MTKEWNLEYPDVGDVGKMIEAKNEAGDTCQGVLSIDDWVPGGPDGEVPSFVIKTETETLSFNDYDEGWRELE